MKEKNIKKGIRWLLALLTLFLALYVLDDDKTYCGIVLVNLGLYLVRK